MNKNAVAGDVNAIAPGGVRLGAPALTSRGFKEADFEKIAEFLDRVVKISVSIQVSRREGGRRGEGGERESRRGGVGEIIVILLFTLLQNAVGKKLVDFASALPANEELKVSSLLPFSSFSCFFSPLLFFPIFVSLLSSSLLLLFTLRIGFESRSRSILEAVPHARLVTFVHHLVSSSCHVTSCHPMSPH